MQRSCARLWNGMEIGTAGDVGGRPQPTDGGKSIARSGDRLADRLCGSGRRHAPTDVTRGAGGEADEASRAGPGEADRAPAAGGRRPLRGRWAGSARRRSTTCVCTRTVRVRRNRCKAIEAQPRCGGDAPRQRDCAARRARQPRRSRPSTWSCSEVQRELPRSLPAAAVLREVTARGRAPQQRRLGAKSSSAPGSNSATTLAQEAATSVDDCHNDVDNIAGAQPSRTA